MSLVSQDTLDQILSFYPNEQHDLVKHQISMVEKIIKKNSDLYTKDKGYQKALDYILKSVIEGDFIIKN